jgi:uncharacterized protein (TIGR02118 family)
VSVRLVVLYRPPEDAAAFDAHYREVHAPLVQSYPGLRTLRVTRTEGLGGQPADVYLMAEMTFDSRDDLEAALASEPGRQSGRDLRNFAGAGITLLVADDEPPYLPA